MINVPPTLLIFQIDSASSPMLNGQFNQPRFIADLLKNMQNGFFIECGAADGESLSNTLLLEMQHNWTGISNCNIQ